MANRYRVDRNNSIRSVPCGMNSILYIGDSLKSANSTFNTAVPGLDDWNKANPKYGVTLAEWNSSKNDYVVINHKGFQK